MSEGRGWRNRIVGHAEVDPRTLVLHPLNPKIHPAEQDRVVMASLERLGWLEEVVQNTVTGHLLDGHDRVELAIRHGEATVPVTLVALPAEDEGVALRVLDASRALAQVHVGRWAALHRQRQEPEGTELHAFFAKLAAGLQVEGEAPAPKAPTEPRAPVDTAALAQAWGVARGQLWGCGRHRVWCGDSTQAESWAVLREEVGQVRGCVTSPPYAEQRAAQYGGVPVEAYVQWFWPVAEHLYAALAPEGSWLLNLKEHSEGIRRPVYVHELVVRLVQQGGWEYLDEYVWPRPGVPGDPVARGKLKNEWEPVFWFAKQVRPVFHPERVMERTAKAIVDTNWQPGLNRLQGTGRDMMGGDGRKDVGWAYPGNRLPSFGVASALGHSAAFPVGLPQWFLELNSERGDWWVDPFGGSGTVLMACEALERCGWLMDQDPRAVAVTLARYQAETGDTPVRLA